MRILNLAILVLVAGCAATAAFAADDQRQFAIKGLGLTTCQRFVEARNAQSPEYFRFGGWINGYISATNRYEAQTFDVVPWQSTGLLAGWLARFCERNPDVLFVRAVVMMVNVLGKERLTTQSNRVETRAGEKVFYVYEIVLQRVQEHLSEMGHYDGAATGKFDSETQKALESFQREAGLQPTGLPDQATLAKLLN